MGTILHREQPKSDNVDRERDKVTCRKQLRWPRTTRLKCTGKVVASESGL